MCMQRLQQTSARTSLQIRHVHSTYTYNELAHVPLKSERISVSILYMVPWANTNLRAKQKRYKTVVATTEH